LGDINDIDQLKCPNPCEREKEKNLLVTLWLVNITNSISLKPDFFLKKMLKSFFFFSFFQFPSSETLSQFKLIIFWNIFLTLFWDEDIMGRLRVMMRTYNFDGWELVLLSLVALIHLVQVFMWCYCTIIKIFFLRIIIIIIKIFGDPLKKSIYVGSIIKLWILLFSISKLFILILEV